MRADRPIVDSLWPSLRRAITSIFSAFSLPLFLLAAVSLIKILGSIGWVELSTALSRLVEIQSQALDHVQRLLASLGLHVPQLAIDAFVIYFFIGSTVARAERDELLAVEPDPGTRGKLLWEGLTKLRAELFFYAIPSVLRGSVVRLLWPTVGLYRLSTPFVIEGPGPAGDDISTSVRAKDLDGFLAMVADHGLIDSQTIYDHRQVLAWEMALSGGAALLGNALTKLI